MGNEWSSPAASVRLEWKERQVKGTDFRDRLFSILLQGRIDCHTRCCNAEVLIISQACRPSAAKFCQTALLTL